MSKRVNSILRRDIPFGVTLPASQPLDISTLTEEEFHVELEKGYDDVIAGNVMTTKEAFDSLRRELDV